jgi:hypothetical protein
LPQRTMTCPWSGTRVPRCSQARQEESGLTDRSGSLTTSKGWYLL